MFAEVHLEQEEGWRPEGAAIATQTSSFSTQREQGPIITPCDNIDATIRARRCACGNDRCGGIISHLAQTNANEEDSTAPLIDNLEMIGIFKDEGEEEEASVTDLIN